MEGATPRCCGPFMDAPLALAASRPLNSGDPTRVPDFALSKQTRITSSSAAKHVDELLRRLRFNRFLAGSARRAAEVVADSVRVDPRANTAARWLSRLHLADSRHAPVVIRSGSWRRPWPARLLNCRRSRRVAGRLGRSVAAARRARPGDPFVRRACRPQTTCWSGHQFEELSIPDTRGSRARTPRLSRSSSSC